MGVQSEPLDFDSSMLGVQNIIKNPTIKGVKGGSGLVSNLIALEKMDKQH